MPTENLIFFNYEKKTNLIIFLSISWILCFRCSVPKIFYYMDIYESLRNDTSLLFIKNLIGIFFFAIYSIEKERAKLTERIDSEQIEKHENGQLVIETRVSKVKRKSIKDLIALNKIKSYFIILKIILTYFAEESYFIVDNNHIFDREVISYRNFLLMMSISFFSHLLIKNNSSVYIHQIIPISLILFGNLVAIIVFQGFHVGTFSYQFKKLSNYVNLYISLGLEFVLEKILLDSDCINIFLLLGTKSLLGTIYFFIIRFVFNRRRIIYADTVTCSLVQKFLYVFFLLLVEFLKLLVIQNFSPLHIFCSMQLGDLLYFIYYTFERTKIYGLEIPSIIFYYIQGFFAFCSFILTLIFSEILILNFCKMNENTKMAIRERSQSDMEGIGISGIELKNKEKEGEIRHTDSVEDDDEDVSS